MGIAKLIVAVEFGERIIDIKFPEMYTGPEGEIFHIVVSDPEGNDFLIVELHAAVRVKAYRSYIRDRGESPVLKADIRIEDGSHTTA